MAETHRPVLLEEAVRALRLGEDGIVIDATYGRGGHSAAILARLGPAGRLVAFDRDPEAVDAARQRFGADPRFTIVQDSFARLQAQAERLGLVGRVTAVLFDLGVSSPQLDTPERGFSFQAEGPLDMRMNPEEGEPASAWLARAPEREIARVLKAYGEERFAGRIARAIVRRRAQRPLRTTRELAELVASVVPTREPGKHPATRTFQALRIQVNGELESLEAGLAGAVAVLAPGGRLAVISFHSLEDRIVKRFLRREARGEPLPPGLPVRGGPRGVRLRLVGRPQRPGPDEVAGNPRARSAILRVAERVAA
ncbi:MAG: 16S rRNA (cytosine(1402)-N(4))-methyltransferase RsmH [Gammaproteobacteria bacterium]|nr:MAG: 16S rRNA (cytosine(1402)-N(4))-methyltransferase RsmH [Gammaproteobacteria bacterium]